MTIKEPIKRKEKDWPGKLKVIEETHPSFGQLQISRITVGGEGKFNLYGSSIKHSNLIALRIHESSHIIEEEHDWYFEQGRIIEVYLSPSQFAEAITTLNVGSGVPCTINYRRDMQDSIESPPINSKQEQHSEHFRERMSKFATNLTEFQHKTNVILTGDKTPSKKERGDIVKELGFIIQEIKENIPYFEQQFKKQMEKTIVEAKAEIEAFVNHAITSTGLKTLQENENKKLIELTED